MKDIRRLVLMVTNAVRTAMSEQGYDLNTDIKMRFNGVGPVRSIKFQINWEAEDGNGNRFRWRQDLPFVEAK